MSLFQKRPVVFFDAILNRAAGVNNSSAGCSGCAGYIKEEYACAASTGKIEVYTVRIANAKTSAKLGNVF